MAALASFNESWVFHEGCDERLVSDFAPGREVSLPHTAVELPFNYFDENAYQRPFTYQKRFAARPEWNGQEIRILFEGAMANARVYLNGEQVAAHKDGYTPFSVRLNGGLRPGENLIALRLDGSENPSIPPFGGQIDYLTYAGIYREAWIEVAAPISIAHAKIETPDVLKPGKAVSVTVELANPQGLPLSGTVTARLKDASGKILREERQDVSGASLRVEMKKLQGIALWRLDDPQLYTLELALDTPAGTDNWSGNFGFRSAEFTPEGFRLNGLPLKLRGLNRHQSFPYVGYALGRAAQERDAEIIRRQLHCNIVRTSHYPQSRWFLDHCDRIGLLVLEEIPGWQHIGGAEWKAEAVENVGRMIRRDWNHPSIVLWGVRINESGDNAEFYRETNSLARALDTTRQTGGVRFITESDLLEDVYTMNDFILGNEELGGNRPRTALRPRGEVTGLDRPVPYLVTEFNGHMYPTKSFDQEQRQTEHVLRHLQVLDAAYGDPQIAGAIGWCAFDYNTHNDFGSGDRICYHGVMDMFREPKFAAYAYASQCDPDDEVILKPVTFWARGERNIGGVLPLIVLTNCDEVELRYGDSLVKQLGSDRKSFPNLPHAPVIFERAHFTAEELGRWGMRWNDGVIAGYVGGKEVAQIRFAADPVVSGLELVADRQNLSAGGRDSTRLMVRALDQMGNKMPFLMEPVSIAVEGPAELVGPSTVPLRGGSTGFWIETTGSPGAIKVTIASQRLGTAQIQVTAQ